MGKGAMGLFGANMADFQLGLALDDKAGGYLETDEEIAQARISAFRGVAAPSLHRRASSPGEEVVGGLNFEFEAVRTVFTRDAPRRLTADQALRHPWFMVGDHELISRNLAKTLDTMKKFNAKRKFKGKVKGIILANRLAKGDLF